MGDIPALIAEGRRHAGVSALAASPATLATVTVPAGVAGPDDPIRVRLVPDDAAVREAAEALTVYCHVCEADRREPCHAVTTGDPAPYPHPERAVAAARRRAGR